MTQPTSRLWFVGITAALCAALTLRMVCLSAEFWLDEIWSLALARSAGSLPGIFLHVRHDNNHPLNTLWLFFCPDAAPVWLYRLHVLAAGLAAVVLAAHVARRDGEADAILAAWLVAGCSWLVFASVEARGYALVVCFALAAFDLLTRTLDTDSRSARVGFWVCSMLGFLSHLTFVHAYLGFVVWSLRRFARQRRSAGDEIRQLLVLHGPVAVFFVGYYLVSIRGMELGGGPPASIPGVLGSLIGQGLGGPGGSWWVVPWVLVAIVVFVCGLRMLAKRDEDRWVFFAVACVGSPALFLVRRPPFLFERYFLVSFVFFLLLTAHVLAALWRRGGAARLLAAGLLLGFLAGNLWHVVDFARTGRGQFQAALAWIVREDPSPGIAVTGDHDFRVRTYLTFYANYLAPGRRVIYHSREELPPEGVPWLIVHRPPGWPPPGEEEVDPVGNAYRLAHSWPSTGPAAWGWYVYRRLVRQPRPVPRREGGAGRQSGRRASSR